MTSHQNLPQAKPSKSTQVVVRMTPDQKHFVQHAAALHGRSVSDFMLTSVQEAAEKAIHDHEVIKLSVRDYEAFVKHLLEPPKALPRMQESFERYFALMGKDH